jgi:HNH endonuclease
MRARLLAVKKVNDSGCWIWTGNKNQYGYGRISWGARKRLVHRLAFQLFKGESPGARLVCHTCDTPACFNPDHLWLGTSHDNTQDAFHKGRRPTGIKLTDELVAEIRERSSRGEGYDRLSRAFGVSKTLIAQVVTRKAWRHVSCLGKEPAK